MNGDNPKVAPTRCMSQLEEMDIRLGKVNRNLSVPELIEIAIQKGEGTLSSTGALAVKTGKFTGRSPDDRYIVDDETTHNNIDWGKINHAISEANFEKIFTRMKKNVRGKEFYIFDGFVGADPDTRLAIRAITDKAWHSLFANQIFIRPTQKELKNHEPEFTLLSVNDFCAIPENEGTRTETFIILNFKKRIILIGSTSYAGERRGWPHSHPAMGPWARYVSAQPGRPRLRRGGADPVGFDARSLAGHDVHGGRLRLPSAEGGPRSLGQQSRLRMFEVRYAQPR